MRTPTALIVAPFVLAVLIPPARADLVWVETSDLRPVASVVEVSRTYLVPSTGLRMTSASVSTTMTANVYDVSPTYYMDASPYYGTRYVPTRSLFRSFRPRRFFERSFVTAVPTSLTPTYYVPTTTYLSPMSTIAGPGLVATSSALCCEMVGAMDVRTVPSPSAAPLKDTSRLVPRGSAEVRERRPAASIDSTVVGPDPEYMEAPALPARDEQVRSAEETTRGTTAASPSARTALPPVGTGRESERSSAVDGTSGNAPGSAGASPTSSDATKSAPTKAATSPPSRSTPTEPAKAATPKAAPSGPGSSLTLPPPPLVDDASTLPEPDATPPVAPLPGDPISPLPKAGETQRRDSYKPVVPPVDVRVRAGRNILQGKVVSSDTKGAEEGVEVVLTDKQGRFLDRTTRTDAFGKFALSLPEGDWTIKLTMPSGRVLAVGQGEITASAGRIIDMYGRDLTNLVIQR